MSKRKNISIKELVRTVYNNFKIIDYKREDGRSFLFVECPHCHSKKWMRKEQVEIAKSCGCLNYKTFFKPLDIKGERFGNLTALEPTDKRDKNNGSQTKKIDLIIYLWYIILIIKYIRFTPDNYINSYWVFLFVLII